MRYEFDKTHLSTLLRNFGLAVALGGLFYGALDDGDLRKAAALGIMGTGMALLGSIRQSSTNNRG